jgi:hypothetical protein
MHVIDDLLAHNTVARGWSPSTRALYRAFCERIMRHTALDVQIGKGGLSFYAQTDSRRLFVCHFNAAPRGGQAELGFADFRQDVLQERLDLPATIQALQAAVGADVPIKVGKVWCSLHFPLARVPRIADAFATHLVAPLR